MSRDSTMQQITVKWTLVQTATYSHSTRPEKFSSSNDLSLDQPTVYIQAFSGQTLMNLGSCMVYM